MLVAVDGRELARIECSRKGRRAVLRRIEAESNFDRATWWRLVRLMLVEALQGAQEVEAAAEFAPYLERIGVDGDPQMPLFIT
jgi:hypothetical protein